MMLWWFCPSKSINWSQLGSLRIHFLWLFSSFLLPCCLFTSLIEDRYKDGTLSSEMEKTKKLKGRLLYYYPTTKVADEGFFPRPFFPILLFLSILVSLSLYSSSFYILFGSRR